MTAPPESREYNVASSLAPGWFLLILLAALIAPIAHGCHGDDIDHEPGIAPPLQSRQESGVK